MFSRTRTSGRHARAERSHREPSRREESRREESRTEESRPRRSLAEGLGTVGQGAGEPGTGEARRDEARPGEAAAGANGGLAAAALPAGPYDLSDAPPGPRRLDLGSLQIPSVSGVEVRVQAGQDGAVQQIYLVEGASVLQLGVFAAPRTEPIWDEVRADIRKSLFDDGVAAEEVAGPYGTELRARVRTPEGLKDLRFVGIDGPRWLVRAVYQGPAAVDPARGERLAECLAGLVVNRGGEARPTKEPLPLRLSPELAAQVPASAARTPGDNGAPAAVPGAAAGTTPAAPRRNTTPGTTPAAPRRKPSPRPRRQPPDGPGPAPGYR